MSLTHRLKDITRLLANSNCSLFWGFSALTLLFSWWNSCSIRCKSGDWLGQSKTFHFFALINSLTELAGCSGSLSWCKMKHFPKNLVTFSWILVGKMVLYPSKLILLLSSYIKSSVKLRKPVPEAAMHAHAMTPPPPCFTDFNPKVYGGYAHGQSITPAFWKLLVILRARILGFIFTAFMICLSSTTVVFSADQVVVGCWRHWWFPNSWFLNVLCFCYSSNWLPLFF